MARKKLMKSAKDTIKLGITSQVGLGALGAVGAVPGMPAASTKVTQAAGAGLGILNVGQLAKNAMTLTDVLEGQTKKVKKRK